MIDVVLFWIDFLLVNFISRLEAKKLKILDKKNF